MKHFDEIYEIAADNYGLVTAAQARDAGVAVSELNRWVRSGRLLRRGHGVYKLARYTPTPLDYYAEACVLVGEDAYLCGEAVLAMHGLALVNPAKLTVATPTRRRKSLPEWVTPVFRQQGKKTYYEGIPCQPLSDALCECKYKVLPERLAAAAASARRDGLLTEAEYDDVMQRMAIG